MAESALDLKPDLTVCIDFLKSWSAGKWPVVLSASFVNTVTGKKNGFVTQQFDQPIKWDAVSAWIAKRQQGGPDDWANIYFAVNPVRGHVDRKTSRSDVAAMIALHIDSDVRPGEDQTLGVARIVKKLAASAQPPSDIIISGGGAQAYWRFAAPVPVDGDEAVADDLALYNVQMQNDIGECDTTQDISRIMRVPGSVNIPDFKKRAKGRVPAMSFWTSTSTVTYSLGDFKKAPPVDVVKTAKYERGFKDSGDYEARVLPTDERLKTVHKKWIDLGLTGADPDGKYIDAGGKVDRSRRALSFCTALLRAGCDAPLVASIIMDPTWVAGDCVRDKGGETKRQLKRLIFRAGKFVGEDETKPVVLRVGKWNEIADKFLLRAEHGAWQHLVHFQDEFYLYDTVGCYVIKEERTVRSAFRKFLEEALTFDGEGEDGKPKFDSFDPNSNDINEGINTLRDRQHKDRDALAPPCWINSTAYDPDAPPARECISMANGILHVPTRTIYDATEDFFTTNMTHLSYDKDAKCPLWIATLKQYWPDVDGKQADEITLLQEIAGYFLLADMTAQKLFFFLGPPRGGKGLISRLLEKLVGLNNVTNPTLASLGTPFGLQSLVNKTLAVIGETAFGKHDDRVLVTNILKTISGGDGIDINRKQTSFLIRYRLLVRFLCCCNEIPGFSDNSRALITRMIVLKFNVSFADHEDETLEDRLEAELAGILTWALEGYDRLQANHKRFTMPQASLDTREAFGRLASPIRTFVEDACDVVGDSACYVTEDMLYKVYEKWCETAGQRPTTKAKLVDGVVSGNPLKLKQTRKKLGTGERLRVISGLKLKDEYAKVRERGSDSKAHTDQEIPF